VGPVMVRVLKTSAGIKVFPCMKMTAPMKSDGCTTLVFYFISDSEYYLKNGGSVTFAIEEVSGKICKKKTIHISQIQATNPYLYKSTPLSIFYSPDKGKLILKSTNKELLVKIYNVSGRLIKSLKLLKENSFRTSGDFSSGIYFFRAYSLSNKKTLIRGKLWVP
jgi:hypothetical protein